MSTENIIKETPLTSSLSICSNTSNQTTNLENKIKMEKSFENTKEKEQMKYLIEISEILLKSIWKSKQIVRPSLCPLKDYLNHVISQSNTTAYTLQCALLYLVRITRQLQNRKWSNKIRLFCGRRMFLGALIIATKYLYDRSFSNASWSKIFGLHPSEINAIQMDFLEVINYDLHISQELDYLWLKMMNGFINYIKNEDLENENKDNINESQSTTTTTTTSSPSSPSSQSEALDQDELQKLDKYRHILKVLIQVVFRYSSSSNINIYTTTNSIIEASAFTTTSSSSTTTTSTTNANIFALNNSNINEDNNNNNNNICIENKSCSSNEDDENDEIIKNVEDQDNETNNNNNNTEDDDNKEELGGNKESIELPNTPPPTPKILRFSNLYSGASSLKLLRTNQHYRSLLRHRSNPRQHSSTLFHTHTSSNQLSYYLSYLAQKQAWSKIKHQQQQQPCHHHCPIFTTINNNNNNSNTSNININNNNNNIFTKTLINLNSNSSSSSSYQLQFNKENEIPQNNNNRNCQTIHIQKRKRIINNQDGLTLDEENENKKPRLQNEYEKEEQEQEQEKENIKVIHVDVDENENENNNEINDANANDEIIYHTPRCNPSLITIHDIKEKNRKIKRSFSESLTSSLSLLSTQYQLNNEYITPSSSSSSASSAPSSSETLYNHPKIVYRISNEILSSPLTTSSSFASSFSSFTNPSSSLSSLNQHVNISNNGNNDDVDLSFGKLNNNNNHLNNNITSFSSYPVASTPNSIFTEEEAAIALIHLNDSTTTTTTTTLITKPHLHFHSYSHSSNSNIHSLLTQYSTIYPEKIYPSPPTTY